VTPATTSLKVWKDATRLLPANKWLPSVCELGEEVEDEDFIGRPARVEETFPGTVRKAVEQGNRQAGTHQQFQSPEHGWIQFVVGNSQHAVAMVNSSDPRRRP